jgi:hypothetical protein
MNASHLFELRGMTSVAFLAFAGVLLVILVISFRSRATVFCQYLKAMTGVELKPKQVRAIFKDRGKDGVREMFLDLIIKQDLQETGPLQIPTNLGAPKKKA